MRENIANTINVNAMLMLLLLDPLIKMFYYYFTAIIIFCNMSCKPKFNHMQNRFA